MAEHDPEKVQRARTTIKRVAEHNRRNRAAADRLAALRLAETDGYVRTALEAAARDLRSEVRVNERWLEDLRRHLPEGER